MKKVSSKTSAVRVVKKKPKKITWRVPNPFILFQEAQRESIKAMYGIDQLREVSVIAGKMWEGMKDAEKAVYVQRSNELRILKVAEMLGTSKPVISVTRVQETHKNDTVSHIDEEKQVSSKKTTIKKIATADLNPTVFVTGFTPTSAEFKPEFELLLHVAKNGYDEYQDGQPSWMDQAPSLQDHWFC